MKEAFRHGGHGDHREKNLEEGKGQIHAAEPPQNSSVTSLISVAEFRSSIVAERFAVSGFARIRPLRALPDYP